MTNNKLNTGQDIEFLKKVAGVALIIIGFIALITPLTHGSWLIFVGAQLLGWHEIFKKKIHKKDKDNVPNP